MDGSRWDAVDRFILGEAWVGSRLDRHLQTLCLDIGPRWASSDGERRAVDYIRGQLQEFGLEDARLEPYELDTWRWSKAEARIPSTGDAIDLLPFQFCPSVDIEAPIRDVGFGTDREMGDAEPLDGAIAVMTLGFEPFSTPESLPDRLGNAARRGCVAAVVVESKSGRRMEYHSPTDWREPVYRGHPLPTMVTSREHGDLLRRVAAEGGTLRIVVESEFYQAQAHNVVAELAGDQWPHEALVLGGHHDTVFGTPGGNDNVSGTSVVLETARVLSSIVQETGSRPGRTIRFATWSGEEQRLAGSSAHVNRHWPDGRKEADRPRLMINLDELSTGTVKGLVLTFPHLRRFIQEQLDDMRDGYACHVMAQIDPSSDHFPFARRGIDAAICWRWRFWGKHPDSDFHHEPGDTIDKVRPRELKEYVAFLARLLWRLSMALPRDWPDNPLTPDAVARRVAEERTQVIRTM